SHRPRLALPSFPTRRSSDLLKFQVVCGETRYNYDLPGDGTPQVFPLQSGDGRYTFRVMQNTTEDKYVEICAVQAEVTLESEFARSEEHTSELQSRFDLVCRL